MKQWIHGTLALALILGSSALAQAGFLSNRAQLDSVLGSFAVTENFEKFNVANGPWGQFAIDVALRSVKPTILRLQ